MWRGARGGGGTSQSAVLHLGLLVALFPSEPLAMLLKRAFLTLETFHSISMSCRHRCVFAQAYSEVRFMLESNLMRKFVATEGFKEALAADQSNGN